MVGRSARFRRWPSRADVRSSGGACRLARGTGCPDDPGLRPLRRAAHRQPGRVEDAAVRTNRRWQRDARTRFQRRQGTGLCRPQGGAGFCGAGGTAAAQRQIPLRGRGGNRQSALAVLPSRACRRACRGPRHLCGRRDVASERAVAVHCVQGSGDPQRRGQRRRGGPALGPLRRNGGQPAARVGGNSGRPAHDRRPDRGHGLL